MLFHVVFTRKLSPLVAANYHGPFHKISHWRLKHIETSSIQPISPVTGYSEWAWATSVGQKATALVLAGHGAVLGHFASKNRFLENGEIKSGSVMPKLPNWVKMPSWSIWWQVWPGHACHMHVLRSQQWEPLAELPNGTSYPSQWGDVNQNV